MNLTPEILRAAYNYLSETEPFHGWNMPDAEDLKFVVTHGRARQGRCCLDHNSAIIEISDAYHKHTSSLMETMAHEMIHLHHYQSGLKKTKHSWHGKVFWAFAREVCAAHGFDPGQF